MESRPLIRRLDESELETASDLLARAFVDDPFTRFILPDAAEREDLLFWYFGTILQYGLEAGDVFTAGNCEGVAVWLSHDHDAAGVDGLQQAGFVDAPDVLGPEAFQRLVRVAGHLASIRKTVFPASHWYLPTLGVDPSWQSRGIGSSLLRHALERADAEGRSCFLETFNEGNVAFYRRHGFALLAEGIVPGSELRYWAFGRVQGERPVAESDRNVECDIASI